jgi:hypothetical protein
MNDFRVNFLLVGAQKAGTTALHDCLRQHPLIGTARHKEVHFFDNEDAFRGPVPDYGIYHSAFDPAPGKTLYGESTPIYLYWRDCPRRIREYNPAMRILVILRDPVARAYSHWRMETGRGAETLSFGEAIRTERERCRQALPLQHRVYSYADRGFYCEQLRRYFSFFPREQILILRQSQLAEDPRALLEQVWRFLGLDAPADLKIEPPAAGAAEHPPAADIEWLATLFEPEVRQLEALIGWDCSDWLRRAQTT